MAGVTDFAQADLRTSVDLVVLARATVHVRGADEKCKEVVGDLVYASTQYVGKANA